MNLAFCGAFDTDQSCDKVDSFFRLIEGAFGKGMPLVWPDILLIGLAGDVPWWLCDDSPLSWDFFRYRIHLDSFRLR